jgi:adenylate cyclase
MGTNGGGAMISGTPRRPSTVGLYAGVGAVFLILVVALIGGIVWYNFKKMTELSLIATDRLVGEMSDKIIERIERFYDPMVAIVAISARTPNIAEMMTLEPKALEFIIRGLTTYPQIFSLYLGDDEGGFFMVSRARTEASAGVEQNLAPPQDAVYAVERIKPAAAGGRAAEWTFLRADGKIIEQRPAVATEYDPRVRPWYSSARESDRVQRTAPYIFAASKEVGVTLSRRVDAIPGVYGADLILSELSVFLAEQRITPLTEVLLFNRAGEVTAHPQGAQVIASQDGGARLTLGKLADRGHPALTALQERFAKEPWSGTKELDTDKGAYLATISPVPDRYGTGEFLATLVPLDEVLKPITRIKQQTLFYSVTLLVLAMPIYIVLVFLLIDRRVGRKPDLFRGSRDEDEDDG